MYYWGKELDYILVECEKCGKILKVQKIYFSVNSNYVKPTVSIQCKCGNTTTETIYSKNSSDLKESNNQVRCPKCKSTQIQLVPKKWSLFTGIFTNKVDRVCMNCKNKF